MIDSCDVVEQNLTIQQLDSDDCPDASPDEYPIEVSLADEARSHTERNLIAYSKYNVTITTTNMAYDVFYQSEIIISDQSSEYYAL